MRNFRILALWLVLPVLETLAQILLKLGGDLPAMPLGFPWLVALLSAPLVWLSFLCDAASFALWINILKHHKLSFAFPVTSLCYVTINLAAWFWLEEPVQPIQIIGLISIVGGVVLLAGLQTEKAAPCPIV